MKLAVTPLIEVLMLVLRYFTCRLLLSSGTTALSWVASRWRAVASSVVRLTRVALATPLIRPQLG